MTTDADLPALPERDWNKSGEEQGLFRKFDVRRCDGSDTTPLGKHYGCDYFVLDVTHDQHARAALAAYADAVEATHPLLASDMRAKYKLAAIAADRERAGSVDVRVVEDAERYRWLRDVVLEFNQTKGAVIVAEFIAPIAYGPDIDAAIDAARSKP